MTQNSVDTATSGGGPYEMASGAIQGVGDIAQGVGSAAAYSANARWARQQAGVERQISYLKGAAAERQGAQVIGAEQAGFGHAGVAPNLWVLSDTAHRSAMAREMELYQGRLAAVKQEQQADIYHAEATSASLGGYIGAVSTLVGSIAKAAMSGAGGG
jgi:hypothetical protein